MLLTINMESDTPIYEQLSQQIVQGIAAGQLQSGEPLPSVRSLAADLGINLHTVNKAYQLLKQDGYVQINRKQGVIVHTGKYLPLDQTFRQRIRKQLKPLVAESICHGMSREQFVQICDEWFDQFKMGEVPEE